MAKKRDKDKLIFLLPEKVLNQLDRIFERLAKDEKLRTLFADDPARALRKMRVKVPSDPNISLINRVVFRLMENEKFIDWSRNYNEELRARYGDTITVNKEIADTVAKEVDIAIRKYLSPKLRAEYRQAGGVKVASFLFIGVAILITVAVVFNAAAAVNVTALWNVAAKVDHVVTADAKATGFIIAKIIMSIGIPLNFSVGGRPRGVGVRVGGVGGWSGPDG